MAETEENEAITEQETNSEYFYSGAMEDTEKSQIHEDCENVVAENPFEGSSSNGSDTNKPIVTPIGSEEDKKEITTTAIIHFETQREVHPGNSSVQPPAACHVIADSVDWSKTPPIVIEARDMSVDKIEAASGVEEKASSAHNDDIHGSDHTTTTSAELQHGDHTNSTGDSGYKSSNKKAMRRFYSESSNSSTVNVTKLQEAEFHMKSENGRRVVIVLGCGEFGRALAIRLQQASLHVILVTRNVHAARMRLASYGVHPSQAAVPAVNLIPPDNPMPSATIDFDEPVCKVADQPIRDTTSSGSGVLELATYAEGLPRGELVFVTSPSSRYHKLPLDLLSRKVLVDVSNRELRAEGKWSSNAEYLQGLVQSSVVVKSLNTISAYSLEHERMMITSQNPTCSNYLWAMKEVQNVLQEAGLPCTRRSGGLCLAKELEKDAVRFFPAGRGALLTAAVVVILLFMLMLMRNQLCDFFIDYQNWDATVFADFLLRNTLQVCGHSALTLLSLTYFPGVLAAYLQLYRGSKFTVFPECLSSWLKARKYLGLCALHLAALHVCTVVVFELPPKDPGAVWMQPTVLGLGAIGFWLLATQGVFSLPSLEARLSWSESMFVHSRLGWAAYVLASGHMILAEWKDLHEWDIKCYFLPQPCQIAAILLIVTILPKLILLLPCIDWRLTKIRRGLYIARSRMT